jgi:hypothetical protein
MVLARRGAEPPFYAISVACYFFLPLQGFVNFLVYTRPRYLNWRKRHPGQSRCKALRNAMSFEPVNATDHLLRGGTGMGRQQSSSFTVRRPIPSTSPDAGSHTLQSSNRRNLCLRLSIATKAQPGDTPIAGNGTTEEGQDTTRQDCAPSEAENEAKIAQASTSSLRETDDDMQTEEDESTGHINGS